LSAKTKTINALRVSMSDQTVEFERYREAVLALSNFCKIYGEDTQETQVFNDFKDYCKENNIDHLATLKPSAIFDEDDPAPPARCDINLKEITAPCIGEWNLDVRGRLDEPQLKKVLFEQIVAAISESHEGDGVNAVSCYAHDSSKVSMDYLIENFDLIFHDLNIVNIESLGVQYRGEKELTWIDIALKAKEISDLYTYCYSVKFSINVTFQFDIGANEDADDVINAVIEEITPVLKSHSIGIDSSVFIQ
jgi:hypothetical protein